MKLNYKRTILIGFAFLSISAFWQMYDNIIPLILKHTFHLGETITGVIMAADNVLALFLLPIFGALSDRVHTRMGKRIPFITGGTILAFIFMMMLPIADNSRNFPMFIVVLGIVLISMGLYRSPAVALMPDLTPKPLLSKGNAVINLMGAVGGIYALIMIKLLAGGGFTPNYTALFLSIGLLMLVSAVIVLVSIRENKLHEQVQKEREIEEEPESTTKKMPADVRRSLFFILISIFLWFTAYNAVTTAFSRYATQVWKLEGGGYADSLMVATAAAIISYIPIGIITSKFGRKKMILGGLVLMGACYLFAGFFGDYHLIINVGFALIGVAWAAINVNSLPIVIAISSYGNVGKYTGYYYAFSMSAQIITPVLSGFFLEYVSYRTLFPYAFVFTVLAFITMTQVRHGDSRPEKKKDMLESYDIED
ncbi:MAG: MFS transporter [Lachnospiraceae bacterium]